MPDTPFYSPAQEAAVQCHVAGPTHTEMKAIVAELRSLHARMATLAASRTFRREMAEVHGDAKGIVQDWQSAAWNVSTVAGVLGSDVFGA